MPLAHSVSSGSRNCPERGFDVNSTFIHTRRKGVVRKVNLEAKSPIETLIFASIYEGDPMQLLPLEVKPHPMEIIYSCAHFTHIDRVCDFCTGPGNLITWQVWC